MTEGQPRELNEEQTTSVINKIEGVEGTLLMGSGIFHEEAALIDLALLAGIRLGMLLQRGDIQGIVWKLRSGLLSSGPVEIAPEGVRREDMVIVEEYDQTAEIQREIARNMASDREGPRGSHAGGIK